MADTIALPPVTNEGEQPLTSADSGEKVLTNKEKRQLAVAAKRQAKEAKSAAAASATSASSKRKRDVSSSQFSPVEDAEGAEEEEVEPVSHKELRRRKKLAKLADSSDPSADPNSLVHPSRQPGGPAAQPRSGFSIWVGNLSFFTAPAKLIDWFNTRGVDRITRVNMPSGARRAEMNRGFCYLDLPNKDMLTAALNLSEQPLDGRKLLIKDGSDFTGRPDINQSALGIARNIPSARENLHGVKYEDEEEKAEGEGEGKQGEGEKVIRGKTGLTKTAQKILRAQKNPPSMTLFMGNLSFATTEAGVRELFDFSASKRKPPKKERKPKSKKPSKKATSDSSSDSDSESSSSSNSNSDSDSDSDSEDDEPTPEAEGGQDDKKEKEKKLPGTGEVIPSAAGIRKVRLGTFEDAPTKCKGFGFLDFHTIEQATASLIDPHNTYLDGRKIILQYASADATRRGASKTQKSAIESKMSRPRNELKVGFRKRPARREENEERKEEAAPEPGSFDPNAELPKKHKETKEERMARREREGGARGGGGRRAKPGAALANAQRASTGIVQSTGVKVTFDE